MRAEAVWFPRAREVEVRAEELPQLGPTDVCVESIASGISHGTEMLVYRGQVPADLDLDLPTLRGSFRFPIKYGYASVGRVTEIGGSVEGVRLGDLVFALHPHQSCYVVPASLAVPLRSDLDPLCGVFLANVETALNVALDAAPRIGERVAVFGQGVVGLLLTQLLRRTGVSELLVIDPIAQRRQMALRLGASAALHPDELRDQRLELDLAIEASGHPSAVGPALEQLAFGGTLVVCSWYGTKLVDVPLGGPFHRRRLRIVSSQVGTIDARLQPRWTHARRLATAVRLVSELELEPLITHRMPFARAADAYALVDNASEDVVQVVLTY